MSENNNRKLVFISKGTPDDDDFTLWLAPRLEAAGYEVFADILCLKYGDRWRKVLTDTLYDQACKMLLCCKDSTLSKTGVLEEIDIANRLVRELGDDRFIIPMRLERNFRAPFGIAGLQYVDFEANWANGLANLLQHLEEENVPRSDFGSVNPEWEKFRSRQSIQIEESPETLISNWLRIASVPDNIRYYVPTGAISIGAVSARCKDSQYPIHYHNRGILTFLNFEEVSEHFGSLASFELKCETNMLEFEQEGMTEINLAPQDAHNILMSMFREAWNAFCREKGFTEYSYSSQQGFHANDNHVGIGKRVPWGRQGERRSAMLRNVARGKVWNFGSTAIPAFWPYPHFKIKTRVLFAELIGEKSAGDIIDNVDHQFRLRRTVCKGWRNKRWYGCLLAFLEILTGDSAYITLKLSPGEKVTVEPTPMSFTSPVTTALPNLDDEESDDTDNSLQMGSDLPLEEGVVDGAS